MFIEHAIWFTLPELNPFYIQPVDRLFRDWRLQVLKTGVCYFLKVDNIPVFQWYHQIWIISMGHLFLPVSHMLGINIEVFFFAYSTAACIESHSIWVWPLSRKFYSIICRFGLLKPASCSEEATNWFLFWPIHKLNRNKCVGHSVAMNSCIDINMFLLHVTLFLPHFHSTGNTVLCHRPL